MKKAAKRHGAPERIITDGLRSYDTSINELGNREKQEIGRWPNSRVENSHLPFRRRERAMASIRRMSLLQKLASVHANLHNHFALKAHPIDRETCNDRRSADPAAWQRLASWAPPALPHLHLAETGSYETDGTAILRKGVQALDPSGRIARLARRPGSAQAYRFC